MILSELLPLLNGVVQRGNGFMAKCPVPAHDDHRQSLALKNGDEAILLKCFAGCETADVLAAIDLTMADLFPEKRGNGGAPEGRQTWDYRDENRMVLSQAVRDPGKQFRFRHPDGHGDWIWNLKDVRRVLYRLPELLKSGPDTVVYIPEGEKHVDRLRSAGATSTCNPGGAGKWRDEYSEFLRGRHVEILPDNDSPGKKHGEKIAHSLNGVAASVKVITLPDLPDKGDIVNWLDAGHDLEELCFLGEAAAEWEPEEIEPQRGGDRRSKGRGSSVDRQTDDATQPQADTVSDMRPTALPLDDGGNGQMFAAMYGDHFRWDRHARRWLHFSEHRWIPDAELDALQAAEELARRRIHDAADIKDADMQKRALAHGVKSASVQGMHNTLIASQHNAPVMDGGDWDNDPNSSGVRNGVMDTRTGKLRPGRPDDRMTMSTGTDYIPDATCPRWDRFLREVFVKKDGQTPDEDLIGYMQRAVGYSITGHTKEHVFLICYNDGANGKSTFLRAISAAFGDYAYNTSSQTFAHMPLKTSKDEIACLEGRRFITAYEVSDSIRFNEDRLKAFAHGDEQTGRHHYARESTYTPRGKLWFACNSLPRAYDPSDGLWRSVRTIPFYATFKDKADDKHLFDKLKAEKEGILAWAIRGAVKWHDHSLDPVPDAVRRSTLEYRRQADGLEDFVQDKCTLDTEAWTSSMVLWSAYMEWAKDNLPVKARLTRRAVGVRAVKRFGRKDNMAARGYGGIRVGKA